MEIRTVEALDDALSDPPAYVVEALRACPGDVVVLGVAGKMGPTLARMVARAHAAIGNGAGKVIGVSRFSNSAERDRLESWGIQTIQGDLLDERFVASLPDAPNIVYMAGMKFGSTGNESLTWAMNAHLPSLVCRRYPSSRIAAFSTGNVYGLCPLHLGGNLETDAPAPVGEYAMSCLGRERIFEHFAQTAGTRVSILRLNYATELRYGVIADLARKVAAGTEIDLAMPAFNAIWQADANAVAIASLTCAASPATVLNIAGPEVLSVRRVCLQLAGTLERECCFAGVESSDAILSNAQKSHRLFGYPRVGASELIDAIAGWVKAGGGTLGKPTHFEARDGKY